MSAKTTATVDVEIFGAVYHVRGQNNPEYLQELAEVVDGRMREVSQHVSTIDTGKIAILAALNLADELAQSRKDQEGERVVIQEKVAELTDELGVALNG